MHENMTSAKAFFTAVIAAGTALWGWFGWLVIVWVTCMFLDYISGSMAARKEHRWSSQAAREGLWHKAGMILAVTVAALGDIVIGLVVNLDGFHLPFTYSVLVCPVVVAWYVLTELGSITENAVLLGAPVPAWLRRGLKITAQAVENMGNEIVREKENNQTGEEKQRHGDDS